MPKYSFWILMCLVAPKGFASSTFIGNGGNSADLDLAAALAQIVYITEDVHTLDEDELCLFDDSFSDQVMLERLQSLSPDQKKVCVQVLKKYSPQLRDLAGGTKIKYRWHDESIFQKVSDGKRRVDAITDAAKMTITFDEQRFLKMDKLRRVALVVHELFHLIKIDGNYLDDEGEFGPFKGEEGKRQLLDVLGVSIAVYGETLNLSEEVAKLQSISRATANHWVGLAIGQSSLKKQKHLLIDEKAVSRVSWLYQYQPRLWGLRVGISGFNLERKNLDFGYETSLESDSYEVGALFRFFPVESYNSRLGQWFINTGLSLTYGSLQYKLQDAYITEEDKSNALGGLLNIDSMFPLMHGLWIQVGATARYLPYELKDFSTKFDAVEYGFLGGIFYAW